MTVKFDDTQVLGSPGDPVGGPGVVRTFGPDER